MLFRRFPMVVARLAALIAILVVSPSAYPQSRDELRSLFPELPLPRTVGEFFPLTGEVEAAGFAAIPDAVAESVFLRGFHGADMFALGRIELGSSTLFITYYVDDSLYLDAKFEIFSYSGSMQRMGYVVAAHQESYPRWGANGQEGVDRRLTAQLSMADNGLVVDLIDEVSILDLSACGQDGCPEPETTTGHSGWLVRNNGQAVQMFAR